MLNSVANHHTHSAAQAGRSSSSNAVSAKDFHTALATQKNDGQQTAGDSFLSKIHNASTPDEKLAIINGFAAGYAAAIKDLEKPAQSQPASTGSTTGAKQGSSGAGQTSNAALANANDKMKGYSALADQIAASDLPPKTKESMLNDIATEMAKLRDEYPPVASDKKTNDAATSDASKASGDASQSGATGGTSEQKPATNGQENKVWTQEVKDGTATIHLGDEYTLNINEADQSVTLTNQFTGAVTKVYGDPHVDVGNDGKEDFHFHDGMTMRLDNGLELRFGTMSNGGDATFTTSLTILQGDRAMQVTGIAGDMDGKNNLKIVQSNEGQALANLTPNGAFVIQEAGKGWETTGHNAVTQGFIDNSELLYKGEKKG